MRSHFATASKSERNVRYLHYALMAASVLNTPRAMDVSVFVVRAFVNCGNCSPPIKSWLENWLSWNGRSARMTWRSSRW